MNRIEQIEELEEMLEEMLEEKVAASKDDAEFKKIMVAARDKDNAVKQATNI